MVNMKRVFGIILGVLFILGGGVYALNVLGITNLDISFDGWWTLFIIVPCLGGLFTDRDKTGSLIGLAVGIFLLLGARDIISYDILWKLILPIIVVVIGIKLIVKAIRPDNVHKENDYVVINETFPEDKRVVKAGAVFSATKCDISHDEVVQQVDLCCIFGGATVIVPDNVKVKLNTFCLFGGISDKRAVKNIDENSPTITINGFCMFGGADIV